VDAIATNSNRRRTATRDIPPADPRSVSLPGPCRKSPAPRWFGPVCGRNRENP